jgi:HlyD family secretion protein
MIADPVQPPARLPPRIAIATKSIHDLLWPHKWLALATILFIGVVVWQATPLVLGPSVPVDRAKRGDLIETVVATGNVATLFRALVGSQIIGTVEKVDVDEGQRVTAGQTLITLEASELKADVVQAQGIVDQAQGSELICQVTNRELVDSVCVPESETHNDDAC